MFAHLGRVTDEGTAGGGTGVITNNGMAAVGFTTLLGWGRRKEPGTSQLGKPGQAEPGAPGVAAPQPRPRPRPRPVAETPVPATPSS